MERPLLLRAKEGNNEKIPCCFRTAMKGACLQNGASPVLVHCNNDSRRSMAATPPANLFFERRLCSLSLSQPHFGSPTGTAGRLTPANTASQHVPQESSCVLRPCRLAPAKLFDAGVQSGMQAVYIIDGGEQGAQEHHHPAQGAPEASRHHDEHTQEG